MEITGSPTAAPQSGWPVFAPSSRSRQAWRSLPLRNTVSGQGWAGNLETSFEGLAPRSIAVRCFRDTPNAQGSGRRVDSAAAAGKSSDPHIHLETCLEREGGNRLIIAQAQRGRKSPSGWTRIRGYGPLAWYIPPEFSQPFQLLLVKLAPPSGRWSYSFYGDSTISRR